jgi:hypothetical protein
MSTAVNDIAVVESGVQCYCGDNVFFVMVVVGAAVEAVKLIRRWKWRLLQSNGCCVRL